MKKYALLLFMPLFLAISCMSVKDSPAYQEPLKYATELQDDIITQSLFTDKDAKISEENIQLLLDGHYKLPERLRVAVINIENGQLIRRSWNDEDYLSSRQKYLSTITSNLNQQKRVEKVTLIPDIMMPSAPSFTSIREAAVRLQADVVLVYSIRGGMYSKYKLFGSDEYKAFATTQVLIMDVRTGLVPFTTVATEDYFSKKQKSDFSGSEAEKRTQEEAVLKTLTTICTEINSFLSK